MSMSDDLKAIEAQFQEGLAAAETMEALEALRVSYLGKKGQLTAIMRSMGQVPPEERPAMGQLANTVRATVDAALKARKEELSAALLEQKMAADAVDVTLPGRRLSQGTQHLINQIREEIEDIFCGLGYTVEDGPYVESTWYNFTALNAPEDHPSRSAKDTFYVVDNAPGTMLHAEETNVQGESDILLRTQTSGVQVHVMENKKPPQEAADLHDLPGHRLPPGHGRRQPPAAVHAGRGPRRRRGHHLWRPQGHARLLHARDLWQGPRHALPPALLPVHRAPCGVCGGKGCRFCKNTGWLEILGAGMVDPNVFEFCGIDPEKYTGFAFGIGVERVAALRYDLPDLRMLMTGDMRFLRQF